MESLVHLINVVDLLAELHIEEVRKLDEDRIATLSDMVMDIDALHNRIQKESDHDTKQVRIAQTPQLTVITRERPETREGGWDLWTALNASVDFRRGQSHPCPGRRPLLISPLQVLYYLFRIIRRGVQNRGSIVAEPGPFGTPPFEDVTAFHLITNVATMRFAESR